MFSVQMSDGTEFTLPAAWEDVFEQYFGNQGYNTDLIAARLQWLVSKYREHRAWPSKFDGVLSDTPAGDDSVYDDDRFYGERWEEAEELRGLGDAEPTDAQLAEAVLYQTMRVGLMQKAASEYAARTGTRPIRIMTVEQLLAERDESGGPQEV